MLPVIRFETSSEARAFQDLAVQSGDIYLSRNVVERGDSVTIFAKVHNVGLVDADTVVVECRDLVTGVPFGADTVDVPAGGNAIAGVPWVVTFPDSHAIEAWVSPHVLDEVSFSNNVATRPVVLGTPVAVEQGVMARERVTFHPPRPNPSTGKVKLGFLLPRPSSTRLTAVDVLGRVVKEWRWSVLGAGSHTMEWDGRDSRGSRVRSGMYFFRLEVGREQVVRRLVFLE